MQQSFKRILSLVLTFAMVLSCVPAQVLATETCDHSYDMTVTGAGCTEEGSVVYTCSACGDSYEEEIAAAGHNYEQTASVEAACGEAGSVTYTCSACGDSYTEETPATGDHAYAEGICAVCGAADPDAVPAEEPTEAPTEEPAEEPAEEPTEVVLDMITTEVNDSTQSSEGDGGDIPIMSSPVYVAEVNTDKYETLEEAIAAAATITTNRPAIYVLADCTVEETVQINTEITLIYAGEGTVPTITVEQVENSVFEVVAGGALTLENVTVKNNGEIVIQDEGSLEIRGTLEVANGGWLESHGDVTIAEGGKLEIQSGANMLNCGEVTNDGGQFINDGCVMDCFDIKNTITSSGENSEYYKYDPLQMELFAAMDAKEDYTWTENHTLTGNLSVHLNDQGQNKLFTLDAARIIVPSGKELRIRSRAVLQNAAEIIVEEGGRLLIEGELTFAGGTWLESRGQIVIKDGGKVELQAGAEMVNHGTITNNGEFINDGFINDFVGIPAGTITGGEGDCRLYDNDLQLELFQAMGKSGYTLKEDYTLKGDLSIPLGDELFVLDGARLYVPADCILYVRSDMQIINGGDLIVQEGSKMVVEGTLEIAEGSWLESWGEIEIDGGTLHILGGGEFLNCGTMTIKNGQFINDGCIDDLGAIRDLITEDNGEYYKYDGYLQQELFDAMNAETGYTLSGEDYTLSGNLSIALGGQETENGWEDNIFVIDNVTLTVPSGCTLYVHSPVMLKDNARILVEDGGKLVINNILHVGTGTVHMYNGSELEDNVGTFDLSHEGATDPYITAYGLNWDNGHFINVGEFGTIPQNGWQLQPDTNHPVIFYYHEWQAAENRWVRTPIAPNDMTRDGGLYFMTLQENEIMSGAENSECYARLGVTEDTALWDKTLYLSYNGAKFPVYVKRGSMGFYSDKAASNDAFLTRFAYVPGEENAFYFICTNPNLTVEDIDLTARMGEEGTVIDAANIVKYDDNIWKIAIKKSATAYDGFGINLDYTFLDEYGNRQYGNQYIDCCLWIHNRKMPEATFVINGIEHSYFAAYDRYTVWNEEAHRDEEVALPQGVSYDYASNTLTLNNAELESLAINYGYPDDVWGTWYNLPNTDLKLNLVGQNYIRANGDVPLRLDDSLAAGLTVTIGGTGSLYVENLNNPGTVGAVNAADLNTVNLVIADSANVTFHVAGQNKWDDGNDAWMHALQGCNRSTLRIKDSATLTMEVPAILEDKTDDNNFGYSGLANFTEVIVEGQATVNLDCLRLHNDEEHGISQKFYQRGGTVNINAKPLVNWNNEGVLYHFYDPVDINEGCLLQIEGGKMNVNVAHSGNIPADGTMIRVGGGTLQISGGQLNLNTNIPGTGIYVDGNEETKGHLNITGGSLNHNGGERRTVLNIAYNGRATFAGGTIKSDNSRLEFSGFAGENQPHAILWTGTNFSGTGNHVVVHGSLKMTGGLFQLNEGRIEVEKTATFTGTGGTLDMNDAVMIVNGTVDVAGAAKLDFDMTKPVEDGTAIEMNHIMTISGNARIDIDIELEQLQDENGEDIHFAGIHNFGNIDQNGGIVNINSNAAFTDDIVSWGNLTLNSGEMNLTGVSGIQMDHNPEWEHAGNFILNDGMTLNVNTTRNGINLFGQSWINGGTVNINVQGTDVAYGIYKLGEGSLDVYGGNISVKAFAEGEEDGIGIVADGSEVALMGGTITVDAEQAMTCWGIVGDAATIGFANLMDMEYNVQLNSETCWAVHEYDGKNNFDLILSHADNAPAKHVTMNGNVQEETLQAVLPTLGTDPDAGGYVLTQAVVLNESMVLAEADGTPIKLHVIRDGKITVRSGATLTIPEGGHVIVANKWEETDRTDGTLIVEAGGQIVNNGILENIQGIVTIMDSANALGYVHGAKAQMITHSDGLSFRTKGIPTACQELKGNVESMDGVNGILAEGENGYASVHIWTPSSLNLSGLVIPENAGLDIDGQEAPAQLTIDEGSTFQVLGGISLGNVNLVVNGTLKNSGEIHTDPNDNAQITINGTYTDAGQGKLFLNNANVTVNGKVIHNDATSSVDINDRSVVTVADNGVMSIHGSFGVGYWKSAPDASATAGTLNIAGQVEIYNYMEAAPFSDETGGIVNIKDGGNLTISVDPAKDAYGYLSIGGVVNVEAGGALTNKNFVVVSGELNVSGNLHNQAGEEYYSEILLVDTEDGTAGGKLIVSEGAIIDNDASISNSSRKGIIRVENADSYVGDAEGSEVCIFWFDDNTVAQSNLAKSLSFLLYEGSNVGVANAMADHARENGYRNSIVLVADEMVVGNDQRLVSDYVIVAQESELIVNGRMTAWEKLNVRSGGELIITKSGKVYAAKELNTFAAEGEYGDSVIDNRGELEFAPDATAKILGRYQDLGVGTLIQDADFDAKGKLYFGELIGNGNNLNMANITFAPVVMGENAEYKLRTAIAAAYDYDAATIWVKTDVHVTEDLEIPANVTVRIAAEGENKGYLTLHNGVTLDNYGTIYADVSYAALKKITDDANATYGGNGIYRGFCGGSDNWMGMSWKLKNGNLTISGNVAMADYGDAAPAPWQNLNVSKVTLGADVTAIGSNAFAGCNASMVIPETVKEFGENCFGEAMQLKVYHGSAAEAYLEREGYADELVSEFHTMQDGHCTYEGCDYGLENVLSDESTATAHEKVEELKNIDTESLKQEMINSEKPKDETGSVPEDTLADKLADLETAVQQERKDNGESEVGVSIKVEGNGTVADAFEDAHEEAAIVGAVLNAEENASEVKLVIAEPKDAHIEDGDFDNFNADASVLFSMTMEGVGDASNLDIPVKITLPVPSNVKDLSKLMIMHYHDGDTVGERVKFTLFTDENGKAFVSFVLTGFSNFGIGQEVAPVGLSAKLSTNTVTVGADPDDVMISVAAKTAWSDDELAEREIDGNYTVNDLRAWYVIEDETTGEEVLLEEALATVGTYIITPKCEENGNYAVVENGVHDATLTVVEEHFVCEIGETKYESLSAALAAAKSGETVKLLQDTTESYVIITPGVTLDLNGKTLEGDYVVGFNGSDLIDNSEENSGILVTDKDSVSLSSNNSQLPIWNGVNGYVFIAIPTFPEAEQTSKYMFLPRFEEASHELLLQDSATSGVNVVVRFSWKEEQTYVHKDFVYLDEHVHNVINSYGEKTPGVYAQMFSVSFTKASDMEEFSVSAVVYSSATGVEIFPH